MINTALFPYLTQPQRRRQQAAFPTNPLGPPLAAAALPAANTTAPMAPAPLATQPVADLARRTDVTSGTAAPTGDMQAAFNPMWIPAIIGGIQALTGGGEDDNAAADAQLALSKQQQDYAIGLMKEYGDPGMRALMEGLGYTWVPDSTTTTEGGGELSISPGAEFWDGLTNSGSQTTTTKGHWTGGPKGPYDTQALDQQMSGVRDTLEPEMQRQLAQANESLSSRGIGRSSLSGGVQSTLRGGFVKELARNRLSLIQKLTAERWSKILNLIAAAQGQAGQATSAANTSLNAATTASQLSQQDQQSQYDYFLDLAKMFAASSGGGGGGNPSANNYYVGDTESNYA